MPVWKPDEILSDDRLVAILQARGIDIARRTVAKYRESLRIPVFGAAPARRPCVPAKASYII